jgi:hypothetical protein
MSPNPSPLKSPAEETAKPPPPLVAQRAAREDDAESLAGIGIERSSVDDGIPGRVLNPAAENHVGGIVGGPTHGLARRTHDDLGKAIAIDIARRRHG